MVGLNNDLQGLDITGFDEPVFEAASIFRSVLDAMSRPGDIIAATSTVETPAGFNKTATAVILTLCDLETAVWLAPDIDTIEARRFFTFQTGCCIVDDARDCDFAVASNATDLALLRALSIGSSEYPDKAATLIFLADAITAAPMLTLSGPGIKDQRNLSVRGAPDGLWTWFQTNAGLFPQGVDVIIASADHLAALPRSVTLEVLPCTLP